MATLALVLLSGCIPFVPDRHSDYLSLSDDEDLEPCVETNDIPVESLSGPSPECEPVGSTLVFPDGGTIEVGSGLGAYTPAPGSDGRTRSYGYATVGVYGVVASSWLDDCDEFKTWGRPEAIAKVEEAFGEFLGQC